MKPKLVIKPGIDELIKIAANDFYEFVTSQKGIVNISLSGGNTPKLLFKEIAESYGGIIDWVKVQIWWGDERCVAPEDDESNYKMTKNYLLNNIDIPEQNIFRIKGENDPVSEAIDYARKIDEMIPKYNEIPKYDLIYLGLGDDGHTASIFPEQIDKFYDPGNCIVAEHPVSGQKRISITGKIINNAQRVFFLITGNKKSRIVYNILNDLPESNNYPATLVSPVSGNYFWYLDGEAASNIQAQFLAQQ